MTGENRNERISFQFLQRSCWTVTQQRIRIILYAVTVQWQSEMSCVAGKELLVKELLVCAAKRFGQRLTAYMTVTP